MFNKRTNSSATRQAPMERHDLARYGTSHGSWGRGVIGTWSTVPRRLQHVSFSRKTAGSQTLEMNFFFRSRPDVSWISVGRVSSFPNLGEDAGNLIQSRPCHDNLMPGCKIFHVPKEQQSSQSSEIHISPESLESPVTGDELKNQVLVFQYRGKFHAVDHVSCIASEYVQCGSHGTDQRGLVALPSPVISSFEWKSV
jgi:hypothetical protein